MPEIEKIKAREAGLAAVGCGTRSIRCRCLPADLCGVGAPAEQDCLRTIPPRENGGNMDVQQMQVGTRYVPCFIDGCGVFVGDVHYAQGDGEVSGTAIEMGSITTLRVRKIHEG